uniref:Uncharacterized protein n=1 Tax=Oryza sativa subsp. japonica TaxID=39947 RepID=Q6L4Z0_ORYSJ|nr:unknown protein [Oryza sativa Japonica Group]USH99765.1 putative retrotransposon protein, Ty3-gypsy subclass [Oryza sativa Japonica Group]
MGKRRGRRRRCSGKRRGGDADGGGGGKRRREGESEEDYCFACKDGGLLRFCDHRNCHKAYHPECVDKDDSFLNSDEQFICNWHTCFICKGRSYYRCFCCPDHSVCRSCVKQAEFVPVMRQTMGFCNNCLRMAIMIEKNVDVDSDGERVDFSDRETYEFLFKDYWDIIREKEGLTLDNMREAYTLLRSGLNCNELSDMEKLPNSEQSSDDDFLGNSDDDDEPVYPSVSNGTSNKVKTILKEGKTKKQVYVGWGSIELIGFMSSIGKDTSKPLDQFGAAEVVKQYIRQNDLLQKDKKKQVICDGKLWSLFRKSKLKYNKIYSLLEKHIAENITPEDESLDSSEDNTDSIMERKSRIMNSELSTPEEVSERYRRCFASLVRENIKLIYLRRTLVIDLLKQPDTFECKVIGCFVRVKNDPREYSRHKPQKLYQLGQVTGKGGLLRQRLGFAVDRVHGNGSRERTAEINPIQNGRPRSNGPRPAHGDDDVGDDVTTGGDSGAHARRRTAALRHERRAPTGSGRHGELTGDQRSGGRSTDGDGDEEEAAAEIGSTAATVLRRSSAATKRRTRTAATWRPRRRSSRATAMTGTAAAHGWSDGGDGGSRLLGARALRTTRGEGEGGDG